LGWNAQAFDHGGARRGSHAAAPADLIVSGDAHLLNLKAFHRIPIITAAEAVNRIAQSTRG